ncbi:MAG TPA: PQQ-binding-like beta-propeller repeat protein [Planctomycetaceae bacterium]|nr:PQQ-binding-like beta-propeller repeat protein [Planctomycetaceae bacterium]
MLTVVRPACTLVVSVVLFAACALPATGSDWPSFRGPDRSGVSKETGLLTKWPTEGPPLVWHTRGAGRGYASLAIAGDRIFTLGDGPSTASDRNEYIVCFDRQTGKQLWSTKTGKPWTSGQPNWQSSRGTPTVDGETVYVVTPYGELVALDTANGKERWKKSLPEDLGGKKGDGWGYSESVLIDGDRLICTPGGPKATMVALDKKTGDLIWKAVVSGNKGAGHSSIMISEIDGTRVYVQDTSSGPIGVRAKDGKVLWSFLAGQGAAAVIPTPIVRGDLVFFSIGYKRGGMLFKQVPGKDGKVKLKQIYPLNPKMANKHGGVVLVGNYLYGDTDDSGVPFCAELMTGHIVWKHRGSGRGSAAMAAADGHLYIHYADGTMVLVPATPKGYTETGSFKVPGSGERPSWSHPVILDGKLYLREQDHVLCYDIHAKQPGSPVAGR